MVRTAPATIHLLTIERSAASAIVLFCQRVAAHRCWQHRCHCMYCPAGEEPDLLSPATCDGMGGAASSVASPMSVATTPCTPNLGASADSGLAWSLPGSSRSAGRPSEIGRGTPSTASMKDARTPSTVGSAGTPLLAAPSPVDGRRGGFAALEDALSRHEAPAVCDATLRWAPLSEARVALLGVSLGAGAGSAGVGAAGPPAAVQLGQRPLLR